MKHNMKIRLYTPKELAERVGLPVSNIRYLIKAGLLKAIYTTPGKRNPKVTDGAWKRYVAKSGGVADG